MNGSIRFAAIALTPFLVAAGTPSTTIHGTFNDAETSCLGVVTPAAPGTVRGTWNLNVKAGGDAEISIVIFRDGQLQANWASVVWSPADDNDPDAFYHYVAVLSPFLTLDVSYTPSSDAFVFQAFHPSSCIGAFRADHVTIKGSADRGGS